MLAAFLLTHHSPASFHFLSLCLCSLFAATIIDTTLSHSWACVSLLRLALTRTDTGCFLPQPSHKLYHIPRLQSPTAIPTAILSAVTVSPWSTTICSTLLCRCCRVILWKSAHFCHGLLPFCLSILDTSRHQLAVFTPFRIGGCYARLCIDLVSCYTISVGGVHCLSLC